MPVLALVVTGQAVAVIDEVRYLGPFMAILIWSTIGIAAVLLLATVALRAARRGLTNTSRRGTLLPHRRLDRILSWLFAFGLGLALGQWRGAPDQPPIGQPLLIEGTVVEVKPEHGFLLEDATVTLDGQRHPITHPLRVSARPFDPPRLGASISLDGELIRPRVALNPTTTPPALPGVFALAHSDPRPGLDPPSWNATLSLALRQRLHFEDSPTATALFRALLLGDRSELGSEARYAYQDTGTAHLLAISGMNLALLGFGLFALLKRSLILFPLTRRYAQGRRITNIAAIAAVLIVALYGKIIAPSDATDRALIAFSIVLSGLLLMRRQSGLRTLTLCILAAATLDPEAVTRAGFQLSVAATCSLVLIVPSVRSLRAWFKDPDRPMRPITRTLGFGLCAFLLTNIVTSLVTLPIGLAWFGQLPLHGFWVNLIAIPMMSFIVFPAGVLWLVLVTLIPPLGDLTAPLLVLLGELFNDFILWSGGLVGASSTASWPLILALIASAAMLMALMTGLRRLGAFTLIATSLAAVAVATPRPGMEMVALDVGHGDALAIRLPEGQRILVDVGGHIRPNANRLLGERTVVPSLLALGFDKVDLLVITHADLDHVGAAATVLERIEVAELWLPPCSRGSPQVDAAVAKVLARGGRVRDVARGPPLTWGGAELEVLWPPAELEHEAGCSMKDNDASIVMRIAFAGRRVLLTGDIETPAETALLSLDHRRDLPELRAPDLYADVLKSPHHGSKSSSSNAFLDSVAPTYAIVSGLPGRAPQPPHEVVLNRYAERKIQAFVTGELGAVRLNITPDGELALGPYSRRPEVLEVRPSPTPH